MDSDNYLVGEIVYVWSRLENDINKEVLFEDEVTQYSVIGRILREKLKWAGVNVRLPDPLISVIEVLTECNPGLSQVILKEILKSCRYIKSPEERYTVKFFDLFSVIIKPCNEVFSENRLNELWNMQKTNDGDNLCDTKDWWLEIYKNREVSL